MSFDISKATIAGPQRITHKGIVVGHTLDGVELTAERDFSDVKVDRYGDTPVDKILTGNRLMVKFKMAQAEWDQWNIAIPETSSYDGSGSKDRADFGADAGASLRDEAGVLNMHPLKLADSDQSQDLTIYKAVSAENVVVPFNNTDQKAIEVTMVALVDEEFGTGRRLGHYGPADVS